MDHTFFLKRCLELAASSRQNGNHPFGSLIVNEHGSIIMEAENTVVTEKDISGHAELNVVRAAAEKFDANILTKATLYTSTEPCAMCCGVIYWSGISRVVYALSGQKMYEHLPKNPTGMRLHLPCRNVFENGDRKVEVIGPLLEEEAKQVHIGFWK
ncbi:MAG: nucleoside deaminase [Bacteroidota bacterium]